jgi:hypothetical protein
MRDQIRARLREYRADALRSISGAVNKTNSEFSGRGHPNSHAYYRSINEKYETGFAEYMDQSTTFIRQVAPGSSAEYVDELWEDKLKQEIMAKPDQNQLKAQLGEALDKLIERKGANFELGFSGSAGRKEPPRIL